MQAAHLHAAHLQAVHHHLHRDIEAAAERQRVEAAALAWGNDVGILGEREQGGAMPGCEDTMDADVSDVHGGLMMVAPDPNHSSLHGFSLMMMAGEPGQQGFPMMVVNQDMVQPALQPCSPSTILSLQTMPSEAAGEVRVSSKKRGRQKGPGKPNSHYLKERELSFKMVLKLPLKSRKLFCVSEFYKYMAESDSESPCKVTEAYAKAGESVGVSAKTTRKWVEDWERRADGTFSESMQGKHVKVEWLLQPVHLQNRALAWIEQNCPKKGDPPRKDSVIKMFRDFCNNDLLLDVQEPGQVGNELDPLTGPNRKISTETARSWLHRLGFHNFKDFRRSNSKSSPAPL
ncbi:hypothetical protein O6H91_16G008900 [Diphasiastrum complanatum]|uniref:Uncharacterized protein n=1 Tax=Diphasiastrum complanatum TaxID=34168 RepID=A0ACC2B9Q1_DIPCM|nr:hypothetical protein O6H91_16G008900 [Diphasiastrum complanatum]